MSCTIPSIFKKKRIQQIIFFSTEYGSFFISSHAIHQHSTLLTKKKTFEQCFSKLAQCVAFLSSQLHKLESQYF